MSARFARPDVYLIAMGVRAVCRIEYKGAVCPLQDEVLNYAVGANVYQRNVPCEALVYTAHQ